MVDVESRGNLNVAAFRVASSAVSIMSMDSCIHWFILSLELNPIQIISPIYSAGSLKILMVLTMCISPKMMIARFPRHDWTLVTRELLYFKYDNKSFVNALHDQFPKAISQGDDRGTMTIQLHQAGSQFIVLNM